MDVRHHFEGKRITVMGLGLLGRGVGDARFLASQGAHLTITDLKDANALASSLAELADFPNITYVLGEHRTSDFQDKDFILKAAGVPLDSPYIEVARKAGIPIKMSASWFAQISGIPIVGVTGTRGKSTTTHMLHAILKQAGIPTLLGGNVKGISTLALLSEATPELRGLFEIDSWQCQGFGDERISPSLSVFTTFMADHMNYYKDDLELYLNDKAQIFLHQKPEDTLVLGRQCEAIVREGYGRAMHQHVVVADEKTLPEEWTLRIPGEHNRYDAGLALAAARSLGVDDAVSKEALEAFAGVEGRLERIREKDGVLFYNDTNSTTPEATQAAIEALPEGKILLIMGGAEKGLSFDTLVPLIAKKVKKVFLLNGSGTLRVRSLFPEASVFDDLNSAVRSAVESAHAGDVVVLSPAFASFGMFKNEYDRGEKFNTIVADLP